MIGIRIREQFLTLSPSTVLNITLNSTAYLGDDNDVIPGSYSLPFTVPLDDHNNEILNHPGRIDNFSKFLKDEPCEIFFDSLRLFTGKVSVKPAGNKEAKLAIIVNDIGDFKNKKLNELDLGGSRVIGSEEDHPRNHAKLTALNPLDYDYVFFPIYNEVYRSERFETIDTTSINLSTHLTTANYNSGNLIYSTGHIIRLTILDEAWTHNGQTTGTTYDFTVFNYNSRDWQNFYAGPGGVFMTGLENMAAMPFVRLQYLLTRIFNEFEITLINNFQDNDELKLLCLYNNYSIYTAERKWDTQIDLRNHVSDSTAAEFLKKLLRHFCLYIEFTDGGQVAEITPLREIAIRPEKYDWSSKANPDYDIDTDDNYPSSLEYEADPNDILFLADTPQVNQGYQGEVETISDMAGAPPVGIYYVYSKNTYFLKTIVLSIEIFVPMNSPNFAYKSGQEGRPFTSKLSYVGWSVTKGPIPRIWPSVKTEGTIPYLQQSGKFSDKLIFYRGMVMDGSYEVPYATSHVYDMEENLIADYSLLWNGPHGMFEQWWKDWFFFLMNKREVSMPLNLTLADIINFRFSDKIRIDNQNYFVRSLQITLTMKGLAPCKAQLMTTL